MVIPAYNERRRLPGTLTEIVRYLAASPLTWELIVVDDGSTDGTADLVRPPARLIRTPVNRGKGHAVRRGVLASRGRLVCFSDADLATPIEELTRLLAAFDGGAVVGSRALPGSRTVVRQAPSRELMAWLGTRLIRIVAAPGVRDTQCGFKLFDGDRARLAFARAEIDGWAFDVEILRLFARFGWPVTEVPVTWSHRPGSKVRPLDYLRTLDELRRLRWQAA